MKIKILISTLSAWLVCLNFSFAGIIHVVTTTQDTRSITELIGGDKVDVFAIATGYQNPHFVDPKPSYIIKLASADMYVTLGLDLESGWSPSLLSSSRNTKIQKGSNGYVDASVGVYLM
jgi:zinc/manganese transport system substrate-binding protein